MTRPRWFRRGCVLPMTSQGATSSLFHRVSGFVDLAPRLRQLVEHAPSVPLRTIVSRFWPYARPYRRWLVVNLVLILLLPALEAAQIWMFKLMIDDVLVPRDFGPFVWIAGSYLALTLLGGIVSFADDYLSTWIGEGFLRSLRTSLFRHVQGLSLDFFERRRLGDVLSRLTGDVSSIEAFVLSGVAQSLAYAVQIAIFAGVLFYLSWELALVSLTVAPIAWVAMRYFTGRISQASREKRRRSGTLTATAAESLANVNLVQAYNRQEMEIQKFDRENVAAYKAEVETTRLKALFSPVVDLLKFAGGLTVIGFGTWELQQGRLSLGGLLVFLTYLGSLYSPIRGLSRLGTSIFAATAGADRIIELLDEQPSVKERTTSR